MRSVIIVVVILVNACGSSPAAVKTGLEGAIATTHLDANNSTLREIRFW